MYGEISAARANQFQAFNGDNTPALLAGELIPFAPNPDPDPRPNGYLKTLSKYTENTVSFGGSHSGIVQFVMVDGSVQGISRDIDPKVLDRMAQRNDGESYDVNGTMNSCLESAGGGGPPVL